MRLIEWSIETISMDRRAKRLIGGRPCFATSTRCIRTPRSDETTDPVASPKDSDGTCTDTAMSSRCRLQRENHVNQGLLAGLARARLEPGIRLRAGEAGGWTHRGRDLVHHSDEPFGSPYREEHTDVRRQGPARDSDRDQRPYERYHGRRLRDAGRLEAPSGRLDGLEHSSRDRDGPWSRCSRNSPGAADRRQSIRGRIDPAHQQGDRGSGVWQMVHRGGFSDRLPWQWSDHGQLRLVRRGPAHWHRFLTRERPAVSPNKPAILRFLKLLNGTIA